MAPRAGKDAIIMNPRARKRIIRFVILTGYCKKKILYRQNNYKNTLKRNIFHYLQRETFLERCLMPNILLCLMHQQRSGRCPYKNKTHVFGHSALFLRDAFLSLSLGLSSAPEVFHWKIQHIFVGVSMRVPKSTELMLTSGENLQKKHDRKLQLTLERAGAAKLKLNSTYRKWKISGREEFGKM